MAIVPPGGAGLVAALRELVDGETTVTALEDGALATARTALLDQSVAEFLPFGSCIGRFAAMCGDSGLPRLTAAQSVHLVQKAARESNYDSILSHAYNIHGIAQSLSRTLTELRHHQISSTDLEEAADSTEDALSAFRFRQLTALNRAFENYCAASGHELASERAFYCLQQADPPPFVIRRLVVICSGERAPLFDDWLKWVARSGVEVICLFAIWPNAVGAFERELAWAESLGDIEDWTEKLSSTERWTQHIFAEQPIDDPIDVTFMECGDNLVQCEWVVRRIAELIRSGAEANRIGVFIRGGGELVTLLSLAAYRHGVHMSGLKSTKLDANGFVSFALDILRAMRDGDLAQLGRLCFSSYFGIEPETAAELAEAMPRYRTAMDDGWDRFGLEMRKSPTLAWLDHLVTWRREAISQDRPLADWAHHLYQIWSRTPVLDQAIKGPNEAQQRDHKAWTLMQRTLRDAALGRGNDNEIGFADFVYLAEELWAQEQIIWEDRYSEVRLCTSLNQLDGYDYFFCLNMVEGVLPARRRQDPVLDDSDRRALASALPHHPPLPLSTDLAAAERGVFITLCASTRKSLFLCYAQADDHQDFVPSFYLDDLRPLLSKIRIERYTRTDFTPRDPDSRDRAAFSSAREIHPDDSEGDQLLSAALAGPKEAAKPAWVRNEEVKELIRPKAGSRIDLSELVQASVCGFRSAFNHRVTFHPPESSASVRALRRLPRNANLVLARSNMEARESLREQASAAEANLEHLPDWEQQLYRSAVERMIDGWADREFGTRTILDLDNFECRVGVESADLEGGITRFDTPYHVRIRYDAVYLSPDCRIGFMYSGYNIKDFRKSDDGEQQLWSILTLMGLGKSKQRAMMVDSGESNRRMLGTRNFYKSVRGSFIWFATYEQGEKERAFDDFSMSRVAKKGVNAAVATLEGAEATPNNGKHCERCQLGDLCRWHKDFGEYLANFDDGGNS